MQVVIISGLSGAGKTNAADWFEDQGYYCVDNMPPALIKNFIDLTILGENKIKKAAFVVDIRGGEFFDDLNKSLAELNDFPEVKYKILFMEASDEVLVRRYNETRRNHPLTTSATTVEVIEEERKQLSELRNKADYIIDSSNMKISDFKIEMERIFVSSKGESSFSINLISFGYKYGIPLETDMVLDLRFIPNPFYMPSLKKLTGNNKKVAWYVLRQPISKDFIKRIDEFVNKVMPYYMKEGKYHLNIAFGCTGGQHRSVAITNEMARIFKAEGKRVTIEHKNLR